MPLAFSGNKGAGKTPFTLMVFAVSSWNKTPVSDWGKREIERVKSVSWTNDPLLALLRCVSGHLTLALMLLAFDRLTAVGSAALTHPFRLILWPRPEVHCNRAQWIAAAECACVWLSVCTDISSWLINMPMRAGRLTGDQSCAVQSSYFLMYPGLLISIKNVWLEITIPVNFWVKQFRETRWGVGEMGCCCVSDDWLVGGI